MSVEGSGVVFAFVLCSWEANKWPIKPEILLEGGNLAQDEGDFTTECDDLSLLSTYYDPQKAISIHSICPAQLPRVLPG